MDEAARERAMARAAWPGQKASLGDSNPPDVSSLEPSARVALVWSVTLDAWAMSGKPLPEYRRSDAPGRLRRLRGST